MDGKLTKQQEIEGQLLRWALADCYAIMKYEAKVEEAVAAIEEDLASQAQDVVEEYEKSLESIREEARKAGLEDRQIVEKAVKLSKKIDVKEAVSLDYETLIKYGELVI